MSTKIQRQPSGLSSTLLRQPQLVKSRSKSRSRELIKKRSSKTSSSGRQSSSSELAQLLILPTKQPSGFNVPVEDNVFMARSITFNKKTKKLGLDEAVSEIFNGRGPGSSKFLFEITSQPSTIIIPGKANVVLASQIFERK